MCSAVSFLGCCSESCAQTGRRGPRGHGCGTVTDDSFPTCLECGQDVGDTEDVTRSPIPQQEQECRGQG